RGSLCQARSRAEKNRLTWFDGKATTGAFNLPFPHLEWNANLALALTARYPFDFLCRFFGCWRRSRNITRFDDCFAQRNLPGKEKGPAGGLRACMSAKK